MTEFEMRGRLAESLKCWHRLSEEESLELVQFCTGQQGGWKPIESAPRDGAPIIVWPPSYRNATSTARWDGDLFAKKPRPYWRRFDVHLVGDCRNNPPTHWQPVLQGPCD